MLEKSPAGRALRIPISLGKNLGGVGEQQGGNNACLRPDSSAGANRKRGCSSGTALGPESRNRCLYLRTPRFCHRLEWPGATAGVSGNLGMGVV
jgi:hypothetical protein